MRPTILLSVFALLAMGEACQASAQHRGPESGPAPGNHAFHGNRGARAFNRNHAPLPYGYGYAYLPSYGDGYDDYDNDDAYQPLPAYDQQPSQPVQPPPPVAEKPTRPVVKEYNWPAPAEASSATSGSEPEAFAIVLKNGSTLSATMVLTSGHGLQYVDPDGKLQRIDIAEVDRAATLRLDRARNLNIHLPAAE